jgi:hypothetical protein
MEPVCVAGCATKNGGDLCPACQITIYGAAYAPNELMSMDQGTNYQYPFEDDLELHLTPSFEDPTSIIIRQREIIGHQEEVIATGKEMLETAQANTELAQRNTTQAQEITKKVQETLRNVVAINSDLQAENESLRQRIRELEALLAKK